MKTFLHKVNFAVRKGIDRVVDAVSPGWGLRKKFPNLHKALDSICDTRIKDHLIASAGKFKFKLAKNDSVMSHQIIHQGAWEPELTALLSKHLSPGDLFLDIGANIGYHSVLSSSLVGLDGKILSFEPDSAIYELLKYNIEANLLSQIIKPYNLAVSDKKEEKVVYSSAKNKGDNRLYAFEDGEVSNRIQCVSIDDFLSENYPTEQQNIRLIKIDTQGYETNVLKGMVRLLEAHKPALIIELCPDMLRDVGSSGEAVMEHLKKHGYSMQAIEKSDELKMYPFTESHFEKVNNSKIPNDHLDLFCT